MSRLRGTLRVFSRGWETTVGGLGPHDGNCVTCVFRCSQGHRFVRTTQYECECGWSGDTVCTISGHDHAGHMLDGDVDIKAANFWMGYT